MKFYLKTYKTLTGNKRILETIKKKSTEAVVYKDDEPAYFVDCFDLQTEANVIMNDLVLCEKRSMRDVVAYIGKKNNINLSIKEVSLFTIEISSEIKNIDLPPLPEEWLN